MHTYGPAEQVGGESRNGGTMRTRQRVSDPRDGAPARNYTPL